MRPKTCDPYIWFRPGRPGKEKGSWHLTHQRPDGPYQKRLGLAETEREAAEKELAAYREGLRRASFGQTGADETAIGVCLEFYATDKGSKTRPDGLAAEVDALDRFWGKRFVSEVTDKTCEEYFAHRTAERDRRATRSLGEHIKASTARRELVTLQAAINYCHKRGKLHLNKPLTLELQAVPDPEIEWLTRHEVARLLRAALGWDRDGRRDRTRINRHLARFILVAFYTGTRHEAILQLQWLRNTKGGWIDFDGGSINPKTGEPYGLLHRKSAAQVDTKKRRPPCAIPARLLPHLLRWRRLSAQYVIEYAGHGIASSLKKSFASAVQLAGLSEEVTPNSLRHSCATLLLRAGRPAWYVAKLLGTSAAMIEKTYGHVDNEHMGEMMQGFDLGRRRKRAA